ncbi:MAG: hypothetical protein AABZ21_07020 [Deltaproteobacteria bacterium]
MTYWNYCDYRCEDCEHLFECPVALKERDQEMRAIAEGREFDPIEAVKETLDETLVMVRRMAKEKGIDLDFLKTEDVKEHDFPLAEKAMEYAVNIMNFTRGIENKMVSENISKAIHDLCWYSSLLSAKLFRCLSGKYEAMEEDDTELKELDMEDANKTAQVAAMAISKCRKALDNLLLEDMPEIKRFYDDLKDIEKGFRTEFPEIEGIEKKQLH